jgi:hypothetical protein
MKRIVTDTAETQVSTDASNIDAEKVQKENIRVEAKTRLRNGQKQNKIIIA